MESSIEFYVYGKKYTLYSLTGTVLKASKFSTTHVSGGGSTSNGSGSVSISSTTTIHDQVFIVDKNNEEYNIRLSDWDINVREGHLLTVCSAFRNGKKTSKFVAVFNRNTNENLYDNKQIGRIFLPPYRRLLAVLSLVALSYYFYSLSIGQQGKERNIGLLYNWGIYFPLACLVLLVIYLTVTRIISKNLANKFKTEYLHPIAEKKQ